jgi:hypothetical protein
MDVDPLHAYAYYRHGVLAEVQHDGWDAAMFEAPADNEAAADLLGQRPDWDPDCGLCRFNAGLATLPGQPAQQEADVENRLGEAPIVAPDAAAC